MGNTIDITGMSKVDVKKLVATEGYAKGSFYKIWKSGKMRVTVTSK